MMCIVHVVYPEHVVRARMQNMDYAHKKYYAYFVICIVPYELLISYARVCIQLRYTHQQYVLLC